MGQSFLEYLEDEKKKKKTATGFDKYLEQSLAGEQERKKAPFHESMLAFVRPLLSGFYGASARTFDALGSAADFISEKTGLSKGDAFKIAADDIREWQELNKEKAVVGGPAFDVLSGVGGAAWDIPNIMALGKFGLPVHGGLMGAAEGGVPGAVQGAVGGALTHGALKGVSTLPFKQRLGASAVFGGATTGGDLEERAKGAATMGVLGALGGRKAEQGPRVIPKDVYDILWGPDSVAPAKARGMAVGVSAELKPVFAKILAEIPHHPLLRKAQDIGYTKERNIRFGKVRDVFDVEKGEAAFNKALSRLKDPLPKEKANTIGDKLTQAEKDLVYDYIRKSPVLGGEVTGTINTMGAIRKILDGDVLQKSELKFLYEAFGKELPEAILKQRGFWAKAFDIVLESTNIPKTFMSTLDMSFGGRQGIFAAAANPKEFARAFSSSFKMFGSEKAYQAMRERMYADKDYALSRATKLGITDIDSPFMAGLKEEPFRGSDLAEKLVRKIPIAGKGVAETIRMSNRAYTGMANHLRFQLFKKYLDMSEIGNPGNPSAHGRQNMEVATRIAKAVNDFTGRGGLGALERNVSLMNVGLFAPRLIASRVKTILAPLTYINAPKPVRKAALQAWGAFVGAGISTIMVAKIIGADVEDDARSADFGKIKIGNTRIDVWGGYQQYVRSAWQFASGQVKSTRTGEIQKIGEGYKPITRAEILSRFLSSKASPAASLVNDFLEGRDFKGEPFMLDKALAERFIPIYASLVVQDAIDLYKDNPEHLFMILPAFFGVGLQTYSPPEKKASSFSDFLKQSIERKK